MNATDHLAMQPRMPKDTADAHVGFSYTSARRHITERYLSDAFAPGCATHFELESVGTNISILTLLEDARTRNAVPDVFAHVVDTPVLPGGLQLSPVPTASLDIDSFWWTGSRIRW